ncbi:MAG: phage tail protein, partial [Planctomycetaceae bacterium]|nr:phage tail protein [Planctomycetaceae bacterium]
MSKTILECAMRNTNALHELKCQNSKVAKQILDADCCYDNGVFSLMSLPCTLPPLFTVRFTAPADYTRGNTLAMKGRTFEFQTSDMKQGKEKHFAAGAVVQLMVDMERGMAFFPGDFVDLSTYATESRRINTEDPLYGGGDLSADRTFGIEDATTSRKGAVQLSNSTDSDDETLAATAKAVKAVYDYAKGKADEVHSHAMSDVVGLDASLAEKAPLESPALSGAPTAPSPTVTDNSDRLATTKWVRDQEYVSRTDHESELTAYVPKTRLIETTAPLLGGGDLTADRTISIADASTTEKGVVQLSAETNNASTSLAATASAVKAAYDFAATKADRSIATGSHDGLMSAADKARFDAGGMVYSSLKLYVRTG